MSVYKSALEHAGKSSADYLMMTEDQHASCDDFGG